MVIQRDKPATLWGWADAGEKVTVTFADQTVTTTADAKGEWTVALKPLKASAEGRTLTVAAENTIVVENVLVGEVWIASGQSNMQWTLSKSGDAQKHIAAANHPHIRFFTVERKPAGEPQVDAKGQWLAVTPETAAGDLTAVGYHFAVELQRELKVPVGILNTNWGGTVAEAWTPREFLLSKPNLKYLVEKYDDAAENYDSQKDQKRYEEAMVKWKAAAEAAKAANKPAPRQPAKPTHPSGNQNSPSTLYNGMIHPFIHMAVRGAIWYQGESNVNRAYEYRTLFPTMIAAWRSRFGIVDMPFYFVQLAPYDYNRGNAAGAQNLPELWDAQLFTLNTVANTGMPVITDIATLNDIHPPNKVDVGKRLALWALAKTYNRSNLFHSGPIFSKATVTGDKIALSFQHDASLASRDGKPLSHFTIAGADQKFKPATATIEGKQIIVASPEVPNPVAVRFAWSNTAEPNLINASRLPASPFRTDDWPLNTQPK
jgi:sialate O-acetylesterase